MNTKGRPPSPGYELKPSPKIRVMNADEEAIIKRLTPRERAHAIAAHDGAGNLLVIVQCVNQLNKDAEQHGMGLWRLSSEFQRRIDMALASTKGSSDGNEHS